MTTTATLDTINAAFQAVQERYEGNIIWLKCQSCKCGYAIRLGVSDMRGSGSRITPSGRPVRWANWHVIRDFLQVLFELEPNAKVKTILECYNGLHGFNKKYGQTYFVPVGMGVVYGQLSVN